MSSYHLYQRADKPTVIQQSPWKICERRSRGDDDENKCNELTSDDVYLEERAGSSASLRLMEIVAHDKTSKSQEGHRDA